MHEPGFAYVLVHLLLQFIANSACVTREHYDEYFACADCIARGKSNKCNHDSITGIEVVTSRASA